jgi:hypothetical protein
MKDLSENTGRKFENFQFVAEDKIGSEPSVRRQRFPRPKKRVNPAFETRFVLLSVHTLVVTIRQTLKVA